MALADLTDRNAVISAIEEFDRLGSEKFYKKYGFGKALKFFLLYEGKHYDSKAIVAVAHRYQFGKPLKNTFSGGLATVVPVLDRLGFKVVSKPIDRELVKGAEEVEKTFWEGGRTAVWVNAFERNPKARARCIEAYGAKCALCRFDFGLVYGSDLSGFIHVHHLVPISQIGSRYELDPLRDLMPVCPNCHAVLHAGKEGHTVEEVRRMLRTCASKAAKEGIGN